ncbi:hypothetical protein A6A07_25020 [Streptomyces sp. CB03911]|nr:hypothetical protein A6A07_25020 [Streptomyces sp. CB03911]
MVQAALLETRAKGGGVAVSGVGDGERDVDADRRRAEGHATTGSTCPKPCQAARSEAERGDYGRRRRGSGQ